MKRNKAAEDIAKDINSLLQDAITEDERTLLIAAKRRLDKKEYLPKIVGGLKGDLTPLATGRKLSPQVSKFYLKLLNSKYSDKGLGRGLFAVWGNSF
ncbi:bacteriocin immunity protein [Ligilactobacillus acidipiscis]|uniref:Lactococcin A immunity protein n=1 Tax=Ligilactobacillus acidipiscis TaxID=89059 RepID=A0A0R2JWE1_9LACO|nr:bacteriocin immunity protein [Ligilactobacillus acidipiscis]KRN79573.1 lactococcin A immunity protein [Ligilactobacillus acidipiscis]SPO49471.1 hypothetical protein PLAC02_P65 [Ligilactobacillus acidipiscis]